MSDAASEASLALSPLERKLVEALRARGSGIAVPEEEVATASGLSADAARGGLERLRGKRLTILEEHHDEHLSLTDRGRETLERGLPERRLLTALASGPKSVDELVTLGALTSEEVPVAIGQLKRLGRLTPGASLTLAPGASTDVPDEAVLAALREGRPVPDPATVPALVRRGLVAKEMRPRRSWRLSPEGTALPLGPEGAPSVGAITSSWLASGAWRTETLRPYDVRAEVPRVRGARSHLYASWLREFEEVLVGLGFEEARGPHGETEFWNSDALFMPQEHPARSIQDLFWIDGVEGRRPPPRLLKGVAAVHEGRPLPRQRLPLSKGWQTPYREDITQRAILRSQTTAVSARYLANHPKAPFRMYSLDTVYRRESLDATHHFAFDQCEGVLGKRGTTLRHLMGLLTQISHALGIREVKFRPSYFPFTEPSVEGYVKHPTLGWIECLPGGLFRPEVLRPLGVRVPVAAWGIGIGRLATVALGISDIRDLYVDDLDRLAEAPL